VLLLALVLCSSCGGTSNPPDAVAKLVITIEGKTHVLVAGRGCFWDEPVYNADKSVAYVIRNEGDPQKGYSAESIVKVSKDGVTDPVFQNSDLKQGNVLELYRVSDDGRRLLVELHFVASKTGRSTHYDTRPVVLDVQKGTISEVEF
jgi:hypothetical protein